ncbi:hypothetical protein BJX70DRAFT_375747 [Aspergillus crustosus]
MRLGDYSQGRGILFERGPVRRHSGIGGVPAISGAGGIRVSSTRRYAPGLGVAR